MASFLSCVARDPTEVNARYPTWLAVDALTKTFHSLADGARVFLAKLRGNESAARAAFNSARNEVGKMVQTSPIMRLRWWRFGVIDAYLGIRMMRLRR